jgi:catechol 2,3-dioxygenase-like lactoylglutathione lyase family enzyme
MDNRGEVAPDTSRTIDLPGETAPQSGTGTGGAPSRLPYGLSLSSTMVVLRAERPLEITAFDHIALRVADVRRAEAFYHELFQMDILTRARRVNGQWEAMPNDYSWNEGVRTGVFPEVVALRNGPIAVLLENAGRGAVMNEPRLAHIALRVTAETLASLRAVVLIRSFTVTQDEPHDFRFIDPFGVVWHLTDQGMSAA